MDLYRWIQMGTSRNDFQAGVCIRIAGGLVKTEIAGPHPRASDSEVGLGWGP